MIAQSKRQPLSKGAYRCLKQIKWYDFYGRGWSCVKQETLAADLHVKRGSIVRYVAELTRKGYLWIKRRPNASAVYHFSCAKGENRTSDVRENRTPVRTADRTSIQLFIKGHLKPGPQLVTTAPTNAYLELIRTMQIPEYLTTPNERKLFRMAQRWITENKPPLITALDIGPIMTLLDKAGAGSLPEDAPLPAIAWPSVQADPLVKLAEAIERKPVRSLTEADYEFLRRKIDG